MKMNRQNTYNSIKLLSRFKISVLAILTVLTIFSCKSSDTGENAEPGGKTTVKVNISAMSFDDVSDANDSGKKASTNNNQRKDEIQRSTISFNKDYDLVAELKAESPSSRIKSSSLPKASGTKAGVVTDIMLAGVRYKMVVFDANGNYITEQDYIRGQENTVTDLVLDGGKPYNFVVYSVNSTTELPAIIFDNNSVKTLSTASLSINGNMDFTYAQQTKTLLAGQNNQVDVILKHKLSQITTTIDASSSGYNITAISSTLDSHYPTASVSLVNGDIIPGGQQGNIAVNFPNLDASKIVSAPTLINANTNNGSYTIQSITIGSIVASNIVGFKDLKIIPGVKYNLKVTLVAKDGYMTYEGLPAVSIGGQIWMRHNLGADVNYDPDLDGNRLFGNSYQFASNVVVASGVAGKVNNLWSNSYVIENINWNANFGSWHEGVLKGQYDPCPKGYRIPSIEEAKELIANTIASNKGEWNWA